MLRHIIQHGDVDFGAFADAGELLRRFQQGVGGNLRARQLEFVNPAVEIHVALFVFFAASAPAGVVSACFFHGGCSFHKLLKYGGYFCNKNILPYNCVFSKGGDAL